MLIVSIKDKMAKKFVHFEVIESLDVFKRNIINQMKNPQSLLGSNPEDFDVYTNGTFNQETGVIDSKLDFVINLSELRPYEGI